MYKGPEAATAVKHEVGEKRRDKSGSGLRIVFLYVDKIPPNGPFGGNRHFLLPHLASLYKPPPLSYHFT